MDMIKMGYYTKREGKRISRTDIPTVGFTFNAKRVINNALCCGHE